MVVRENEHLKRMAEVGAKVPVIKGGAKLILNRNLGFKYVLDDSCRWHVLTYDN